jgi:DNA-binding helix-hairpin-helix protein with protein kinase domain
VSWPRTKLTFFARPGNERVVLQDWVGDGFEASVWSVGQGRVAKIYRRERLDAAKRDALQRKLSFLMSLRGSALGHPALSHVAWPQSSMIDEKGQVVGFLMPSVKGVPLHLVIKDPTWTLWERVEVARQLARIVAALHGRNVHVGDLSPNNVLVFRGAHGIQVFLIDADSLSLPGFPGAVVTSRYMLPAVHRGELACAASPVGDAHALAFLAFELLLGGVSPYAHTHGEDSEEENIKKQFFALVENPARVPTEPLPWLARWRELPLAARDMFEAALRRGTFARPNANAWVALLSSTSFSRSWADVARPRSLGRKLAIFGWRNKRKTA